MFIKVSRTTLDSFGLSHDYAQDEEDTTARIKGQHNPRLSGKWLLKWFVFE